MLQWTGTATTPNNTMESCDGSAWRPIPFADTSDQTPDAFTFTALTNQSLNSLVQSNTPTISSFTGTLVASVSGGGNPGNQHQWRGVGDIWRH